ncbi:MAG: OmpA family protein [Planctomycetes bacterium]|nr:OmpA family protein [Planctomycetota bacterium]
MIRKLLLTVSIALASLATSCTTRYQDMLKERDQQIRDLSGTVARQRGELDELNRRAITPTPAPVEATGDKQSPNLLQQINDEVGQGANAVYDRGGRISIGVKDSVTFDPGSTVLKDSSHKVLRNVAGVMKNRFGGKRFFIEGHTDSDPITKTKDKYQDNMELSMKRADAVRRFLISQGVPESSIAVVGYGQFDPAGKDKASNRRVQIVVGDKL